MNRTHLYTTQMHNKKNIGKNTIEERAINLAQYIIDSKDTVRGTAKKFRNKQKYGTQRCNRKANKNKFCSRETSKRNIK